MMAPTVVTSRRRRPGGSGRYSSWVRSSGVTGAVVIWEERTDLGPGCSGPPPGHEIVERTGVGGAGAQVRARDLEVGDLDLLRPPAPILHRDVGAGAVHDHQRRQLAHDVDALPRVELAGRVRAEHQEQLGLGYFEGDLLQRVGGERLAAAVDLDPTGLNALHVADRRLHQREAVLGRRDLARARLLPRDVGDDEQYAIERKGVADVHRGHQVTDVDRVERAAENSDAGVAAHAWCLQHRVSHPLGRVASVELTAAQQQIVEHERGPLLVLGGPGTGRTTALLHRYLRLRGDTLVVARNRAAADRFRDAALPHLRGGLDALAVTTVHGLAFDVVRRHRAEPRLLTAAEQWATVARLLHREADDERAADWWPTLRPLLRRRAFVDEVAEAVLRGQAAGAAPPDDPRWSELAGFTRRYLAALAAVGAVDATGLLVAAVESWNGAAFAHVLVDDHDLAQPDRAVDRLLSRVAEGAASITAVGALPAALPGERDTVAVTLDRPFRRPSPPELVLCRHPAVEPEAVAGECSTSSPRQTIRPSPDSDGVTTPARSLNRTRSGSPDRVFNVVTSPDSAHVRSKAALATAPVPHASVSASTPRSYVRMAQPAPSLATKLTFAPSGSAGS